MSSRSKPFFQDPALAFLVMSAAVAKILVIWLAANVFNQSSWLAHIFVDIWGWNDFLAKCKEGLIPYVHMTKEYPVGAGLLYWFMSLFLPRHFTPLELLTTHSLFMAVGDLINVCIIYRILTAINAGKAWWLTLIFVVTPTALVLTPVRFETYVITFVLLGYLCHLKRRPYLATLFWSIGCTLKWFPVFFIMTQELIYFSSRKDLKRLAAVSLIFAVVNVAFNLPFILAGYGMVGNADSWISTYWFHVRRPLYWDTLLGIGELWWGNLPWERFASLWSGALVFASVFLRPRLKLEYKGILICIAAIFFNRIYSTQFHLWFYPFLFFVIARETLARAQILLLIFVVLDLLNIFVYPFSFSWCLQEIGGFAPLAASTGGGTGTLLFSLAIVARTLVLIPLYWLIVHGPLQKKEAA